MRGGERAAGQTQREDGFAHVGEVGEIGQPQIRAEGEDLFDFAARDPPKGVEVVDEAVGEDAAAGGEKLASRGGLVESVHVDPPQLPDLPGCEPFAGRGVGGVESALKADVDGDPGGLGRSVGPLRRSDVERHRFFAEDRGAQADGGFDVARVGVGGRGEDDAVEIFRIEEVFDGADLGAQFVRRPLGLFGDDVGDDEAFDLRRQDSRMHDSDASDA